MQKAISQYLSKYAEPECQALVHFPKKTFQQILLIPAYQESSEFCERLQRQFNDLSLLVVVVINQPESENDESHQQQLFDFFHQKLSLLWQEENLYLYQKESAEITFLVVTRFEQGNRIPVKQGVGLARKIGADIACWLIANQSIECSWVGSTDADAELPLDYFSIMSGNSLSIEGAGIFDFCHVASEDKVVYEATKLYEQWLHYYVAGLQWAGSRYAFYTIGSCLAFHFASYCQVRGFPKRSGGEDFYLLNKMAKLAPIQKFPTQIKLQSRLSQRVPFGTGPAVSKLLQEQASELSYQVYNPQVFVALKHLLRSFPHLWEARNNIQSWAGKLSLSTWNALVELGFDDAIIKIFNNSPGQKQFDQQIHGWFDGFRTLRFIHLLEQSGYSMVNLAEARSSAPFKFSTP